VRFDAQVELCQLVILRYHFWISIRYRDNTEHRDLNIHIDIDVDHQVNQSINIRLMTGMSKQANMYDVGYR